MVAVETCAATDSACLDPDATHDFSAFTVSYPPRPDTWPLELQTTFGGRILDLSNAYCGVVSFDIASQRWFGPGQSGINALLSGSGMPPAVAAPSAISGAEALTHGPPVAVTSSCS